MTSLRKYYFIFLCLASTLIVSCSVKNWGDHNSMEDIPDVPRLIIRGLVSDSASTEPLSAIRVSIAGMEEQTALGYNYAFTDTTGRYIISRYLGRAIPDSLVLVASDTTGVYEAQEQKLIREEHYFLDDLKQSGLNLTVDFVLKKK